MRAKHASPVPLGEFPALVVEILGGGDVMKEGPTLSRRDETGREDDSMEWDVVFSHELVELDFIVVSPPLCVALLQKVGSDGDIADRSIKPNIKHLLFELLER